MADSFLRKWFGGPPAAGPAVEEARAELDCLAAAQPALRPLLDWLCALLPDLSPPAGAAPALPLKPEQAQAKLRGGIPLLRGERLAIDDAQAFRQRWQRTCAALAAQQRDGAAEALADAVRHRRLDPAVLMEAVLGGQPEVVRQQAEELGLEPGLTAAILRFTLFPLFTSVAAALGPWRTGIDWKQGYCPTCGNWPLLGEFRGLEQARFLRCGLCASEWEVPRLWCPFCDNRDHDQLGFLHREDEKTKYRASVCHRCRGYVKMISTLAALPPLRLLVADAATLYLDLAAAERGYTSHF